ncbi:tryptophan synthase subunit alpha [Tenuifilum thalassicum]|uniref:Tryptophan synthase alpha chain n=1 Tax=Tenuifilum thalassicum TaxID=2590900 RepID=A0A7D4BC64_9BACT|nr:tryptophan synthase subunit alpha [Tenuifilum thalassicum]QKG80600.1 tryptophan synthase subunit alpha [Tenuifilum thalassicum]
MNSIKKQLETHDKVLSVFVTAGYPKVNSLYEILPALEKSGVHLVEVGIPFSDPLADGATIQHTSKVAINNGMTLKLIFNQLKEIIPALNVPVILMGYLNSVYHFGIENFYKHCKQVGVSGVIIPDIPLVELQKNYLPFSKKYEIPHILMVTPTTPASRVKQIDDLAEGFIYAVSNSSTTGGDNSRSNIDVAYLKELQSLRLKNDVLVGFGINSRDAYELACKYAKGAIVGTAFLKSISEYDGNLCERVLCFVNKLKNR